jgi:diguanylate cyclase (GGDEF)-like protein
MPRPFTIAIVDDDAAIRRLVRLFLKRAGYDTLECTTGGEAREQLGDAEWDLAILDRRLPDLDGVVLAHELKSNQNLRARYIIMLTGEDEQEDKIEGLELGADDYITKPFQYPELLARIRAGKRIVDLQTELIEANKRLELLSITDGLTKLYNHRYFQDELARAFDESQRYQRPLSLAIIDIDFFKKVNDTYGHAVGDEVLRHVSALFRDSIRSTDLAARYGGEEFAVMMPETELDDAIAFAEKIRQLTVESHGQRRRLQRAALAHPLREGDGGRRRQGAVPGEEGRPEPGAGGEAARRHAHGAERAAGGVRTSYWLLVTGCW